MSRPSKTGPTSDPRADYDYAGGDVEVSSVVTDLATHVECEVRFDSYTRQLYATDASAYEVEPVGVAFPTSTAEVSTIVEFCADAGVAVLPRGGGTSLAGQSVNEAVVLDFTRHMDGIESVDPGDRSARVEAGCYLGDLNERLADHDLKFAPDPAWGDKSAIGGAIGNNSTGSHSLKYGKTDAYVESVEAVLADGTITELGEVEVETVRERADTSTDGILPRVYAEIVRILDEERDEVRERYPEMKRNVSGYNLDELVAAAETGTVNLARLLAGSEGTLALVTAASVTLEPVPETKSIALLIYEDLLDAMEDVAPILEHDPAAVEVMDDVLLDLARGTEEFGDVVDLLPETADSVLLVEFYAADDDHARRQVEDLIADRRRGAAPSDREGAVVTGADRWAVDAMKAYDAETRATFWKMRKSGLPILLGRTTDEKHVSFVEDTAVPPERLPAYVADVQAVLDDHDTFASFYAHAGPGVLHIRPLINTKTVDGREAFESIATRITDLVVEYGGSVSGEHGDGRARTQWNRRLYGDRLWQTFRDLKTAFDPDWVLNPGNVCGDHDMTENLRWGPDTAFDAGFDPALAWETDNGFQGMVELCHGCGGCRGPQGTTGGVMCPTYRAAEEEIQSTRGRANMLRQAMTGSLPDDEQFSEEFRTEVLDLCVGCKGCAKDCPSEVDLAKLKAEMTHAHHERHGASLRDRLFANIDLVSRLGSMTAPLSNLADRVPLARVLLERTLGIAREADLPTFERETLHDWYESRGGSAVSAADATRRAILFPDTYTTYSEPGVGKAAVRVLEAAGIHVTVPADLAPSGRPAYSKGFLDTARERAAANVDALAPRVADGWDVVAIEPSDAVMFQSDYPDLLTAGETPDAAAVVEDVAANSYGLLEYLDQFRLDEAFDFDAVDGTLTYHGHCHQKATSKDHHAVAVLRRAGYAVDPLDSTCCGMAGSFGYEAEHYSLSQSIADILRDQIDASPGQQVVAPGASCRSQLADDADPDHPVVALERAMPGEPG